MNMQLMTLEEASGLLKISVLEVRRLAKRGVLPGVKIGNRWRINTEALAAQINGNPPPTGQTA